MNDAARRDALWNAYYDMRHATESALQATVAIGLGYPGTVYEDCARRYLKQAAEHLGYTLTRKQSEAA